MNNPSQELESRLPLSNRVRPEEYKIEIKKLPEVFHKAAVRVRNGKYWVIGLIVIIIALIISLPCWYSDYAKVIILNELQAFSEEKFSSSFLLSVYLVSKFVIFAFLVSILGWLIKIYNSLRRLEITYHDKAATAETFALLYVDDDARLDEHAFGLFFEPTLQQAEKQKQHDHEHHTHLADSMADLIDKIVESLKRK
jgi:hypothetical protein